MIADRYLELLSDHLKDCFEMCQTDLVKQDNDPCHTTKVIKYQFDFLKQSILKNDVEKSSYGFMYPRGVCTQTCT